MNLEEAVAQLISLGETDPLNIARKVASQQGNEWVAEQLAAYAEDFLADLARQRLNAIRRGAELALRPGDMVATADLRVAKMWIPNVGWKRAADLTSDDLEARARMYDRLAGASLRRATWLREVIDLMAEEGAKTLGRLKRALPPLPDAELAELVAA